MPDRTALRALRVMVFTAVCVTLGGYGHWLDSGHHPMAAPVVLGAGIVLFAAGRLSRRERSLAQIAAAVVAMQVVLHVVFVLCTGGRSADGHGTAGHGHAHAAPAGVPAPEPELGVTAGMALFHLVAALLCAVWLRGGEAALWSLCRRITASTGGRLRPLLAALAAALAAGFGVVPHPRVPVAGPGLAEPLPSYLLRHAVSRRGPPCAVSTG